MKTTTSYFSPFKIFLILFLGVFFSQLTFSQTNAKREMRGVWISTVYNLDWPSKSSLSPDEQKKEFTDLLDSLQRDGINAVFVQVRPCSDAFYKSDFEPWSQWLTGKQGRRPSPEYDPLEFMVAESHKRAIEFHAWLNPFRAMIDTATQQLSEDNLVFREPDRFVAYGKGLYFDPGLPKNRDYITTIVKDIVQRYDIDGIHFDDYFYPYPIWGVPFPDTTSFALFNRGYNDRHVDEWRRENVDIIIKMIHDTIVANKPFVKFGIGPFGIWRNKSVDPRGSATNGLANYDNLYADVLKWLQYGWIDYVAPQLYWTIGMQNADYKILLDWWSGKTFGKHLYIGHALYNLDSQSKIADWRNPGEIPAQINLNRSNKQVQGSVYFRSAFLAKNPLGVTDSLRQQYYRTPALVPVMNWIDNVAPQAPSNINAKKVARSTLLSWDEAPSQGSTNAAIDSAWYYIVYKQAGEFAGNTQNPADIYTITTSPYIVLDSRWGFRREKFVFTVTAVDRIHNESRQSAAVVLKLKK